MRPFADYRRGTFAGSGILRPRLLPACNSHKTEGNSSNALMGGGKNPAETLQQLLREDGNFDGEGIEARQVGIVAVDGRAAFYTAREAADSNWAGARSEAGYSVQGNGLAGPQVVDAMERALLNTRWRRASDSIRPPARASVHSGRQRCCRLRTMCARSEAGSAELAGSTKNRAVQAEDRRSLNTR